MAKAYWISCYRSVSDPDKLAAYAKLAGPAIAAGGGRFMVRGMPAKTYRGRAESTDRDDRVRQRGPGHGDA